MEIRATKVFEKWFASLRDERAKDRINARIRLMAKGHFGDVRAIRSGVSEARIHHGPGYRLYFTTRGQEIIILLAGGDKKSQERDILRAIELAGTIPKE